MDDVTIATHAAMPDGSTDDRLLADAIGAAGARARLAVWNDPGIDWAASPRVVVRSTWDYHLEPAGWFRWLDALAPVTRLVNDVDTLRWNSDKRYLVELSAAGVAIVPTEHVAAGTGADLIARCAARAWDDVVVKPTIGASAKGARRFTGPAIGASGQAHLDALLARGGALIQPFQPAVQAERERSLVYLGGAFSHAFSKPAFLTGTGDGLDERIHAATAEERALAGAVLRSVPRPVTYARVDMVPTPDGPRLMELELIEPDLGLRLHAPAAAALAGAILTLS
jgi:glutathione synthase/RimK-type ligase-like ATP-grasp enzyme